jgi:hypothetical protein
MINWSENYWQPKQKRQWLTNESADSRLYWINYALEGSEVVFRLERRGEDDYTVMRGGLLIEFLPRILIGEHSVTLYRGPKREAEQVLERIMKGYAENYKKF